MSTKLKLPSAELSKESHETLVPINAKYGFTPNVLALIGNNPNALKATLAFAGAFDNDAGGLNAEERHLLLISASDENGCNYCTAAHSTAGKMSGLEADVIKNVLAKRSTGNDKYDALVTLVRSIVSLRGWPDESAVKGFFQSGYGDTELLSVVHGVAYKTMTNYVNHLYGVTVDEMFAKTYESIVNT
jgi:uncharacterized peroxidase-related enzyme